jgi:hypothetical protein
MPLRIQDFIKQYDNYPVLFVGGRLEFKIFGGFLYLG